MKRNIWILVLVSLLTIGCAKTTRVRIKNSSNNNYTSISVKAVNAATAVAFYDVRKGRTTSEVEWTDKNNFTAKVITYSPSTTDKTGKIVLEAEKLNTIEIKDGNQESSEIVYTNTASAPAIQP